MERTDNRWERWMEYESAVRKCVARRARQKADVEDVVSEVMVKFVEAPEELTLNQTLGVARNAIRLTTARAAREGVSLDEELAAGHEFSAPVAEPETTRLDVKYLAGKWFDFMRSLDGRDRLILDYMTRRDTAVHVAETLRTTRMSVWRRRKHVVRKMSAFFDVPESKLQQELALAIPHPNQHTYAEL